MMIWKAKKLSFGVKIIATGVTSFSLEGATKNIQLFLEKKKPKALVEYEKLTFYKVSFYDGVSLQGPSILSIWSILGWIQVVWRSAKPFIM